VRAVISAAVSTAASAFRSTFLLCRPVSFHEFSKKKSAWCTSIWEMDKMRAIVSTRISSGKRRDCGALRVAVRMLSRPSNLLTNELHTSQSSDHDFLVGHSVHPSALIPGTTGFSLNRNTTRHNTNVLFGTGRFSAQIGATRVSSLATISHKDFKPSTACSVRQHCAKQRAAACANIEKEIR